MKIGLILIGGSLKGIYGHTGTLRALEALRIKPDTIMGASAGSIVASFYATGMSLLEMYKKMTSLRANEFLDMYSKAWLFSEFVFHKGRHFMGFVAGDKLEQYVRKSLNNKDSFQQTNLPLYVTATNLNTYDLEVFSSGTIADKVRASTSIPLMFKPKKLNNTYYVDGAVVKEKLPKAFVDLDPELDLIIISNFSYEPADFEDAYIDGNPLPIQEIVRRTFVMHEQTTFPSQIGKTKIVVIKPEIRIPVDIFHPNKHTAFQVYQQSKKYVKYHLKQELTNLGYYENGRLKDCA
jgi:NTE family protein